MPLTVGALFKYKTEALAVRHQAAPFGMSDANHTVGHACSLGVLPENAPNLINLLAQIRLVIDRNVRLAIQNQRTRAVGEVHRPNARNLDLLARWQCGKRRCRA